MLFFSHKNCVAEFHTMKISWTKYPAAGNRIYMENYVFSPYFCALIIYFHSVTKTKFVITFCYHFIRLNMYYFLLFFNSLHTNEKWFLNCNSWIYICMYVYINNAQEKYLAVSFTDAFISLIDIYFSIVNLIIHECYC